MTMKKSKKQIKQRKSFINRWRKYSFGKKISIIGLAVAITVGVSEGFWSLLNYIHEQEILFIQQDASLEVKYVYINDFNYELYELEKDAFMYIVDANQLVRTTVLEVLEENRDWYINTGFLVIKNSSDITVQNVKLNMKKQEHSTYQIDITNNTNNASLYNINKSDISEFIALEIAQLIPGESVAIPIYLSTNKEDTRIIVEYDPRDIKYLNTLTNTEVRDTIRDESNDYTEALDFAGGRGSAPE